MTATPSREVWRFASEAPADFSCGRKFINFAKYNSKPGKVTTFYSQILFTASQGFCGLAAVVFVAVLPAAGVAAGRVAGSQKGRYHSKKVRAAALFLSSICRGE